MHQDTEIGGGQLRENFLRLIDSHAHIHLSCMKGQRATKGKSAADKIYDKIEDKLQDKLQEWFQGSGHHQVEALKLTFIMYERTEGN